MLWNGIRWFILFQVAMETNAKMTEDASEEDVGVINVKTLL